jgi:hypothetical protein
MWPDLPLADRIVVECFGCRTPWVGGRIARSTTWSQAARGDSVRAWGRRGRARVHHATPSANSSSCESPASGQVPFPCFQVHGNAGTTACRSPLQPGPRRRTRAIKRRPALAGRGTGRGGASATTAGSYMMSDASLRRARGAGRPIGPRSGASMKRRTGLVVATAKAPRWPRCTQALQSYPCAGRPAYRGSTIGEQSCNVVIRGS